MESKRGALAGMQSLNPDNYLAFYKPFLFICIEVQISVYSVMNVNIASEVANFVSEYLCLAVFMA